MKMGGESSVGEGSATKVDRVLDCTGLFCPVPVLKTRIELDRMPANEVLEVIADDPAAESDIRSLVKRLNHQILEVKNVDKAVHVLIRKLGGARNE